MRQAALVAGLNEWRIASGCNGRPLAVVANRTPRIVLLRASSRRCRPVFKQPCIRGRDEPMPAEEHRSERLSDSSLDLLLRPLYRLLAWTFGAVGALFFFFPDGTIDALNWAGSWLAFPPAPYISHRFWLSLGVAYMAVVTALAALVAPAPTERRLLMVPLAIGKATSSLTCLWFFVVDARYFVYLANFLVDASLAALAWLTYAATTPAPPSLSPRSRRVLQAVAEALFPPGSSKLEGQALVAEVEQHLCSFGPLAVRGFSLLLAFLDWNPLLFHGQRVRLSALPWQERVPILEAAEQSRWLLRRQAVHTLKLFFGLQAYRNRELRAAVLKGDRYLEEKLSQARARRERGERGPYPEPQPLS